MVVGVYGRDTHLLADRKQRHRAKEAKPRYFTPSLRISPNDLLPLVRPHLIKFPNPSK
jgi:hypothetical protein